MRIAVVGAGGVGGYFGAKLAASGSDVAFLARGAHLEAMRSRGLEVRSPLGDVRVEKVRATADPREIGPVDAVLFAVKLYDGEPAARSLGPLLGPATPVVTLQNGVESVELLSRAVGREHVMGGVAYVAAVLDEPGVIRHTAMGSVIFGELDRSSTPRAAALLEACTAAGFGARVSDRIDVEIWEKFVRLAVFSGVCAVTRSTIGAIRGDPETLRMLVDALGETLAVARARGIPLRDGLRAEILQMVQDLPAASKASMLEDLERGRPLELPWLSGAVVRLGRELGVATPVHAFIAAALKLQAGGRGA
ncbi:MAG: 2-dehydropantoate 2-reductase [Acidobacteria bacterium]|nr:2-dehydropantoate 2-reductase [Acidobacteriota bacterium]